MDSVYIQFSLTPSTSCGIPSILSGIPSISPGIPSILFGTPSMLFGIPSILFGIPSHRMEIEYYKNILCQDTSLTMSSAENTSLNIQNIFQTTRCHLYDEEHSEYYYYDFTVCRGINSFETQVTQSTAKVSTYENTKQSTLNIQQSTLVLDMLRRFRLFLQCFLDIFWQNILFSTL